MSTLQTRLQEVMGTEDLALAPVEIIGAEDQGLVLADNEMAVATVTINEHEKELVNIQHDINNVEDRIADIEENVGGLEAMMSGETTWNPELAMKLYNDACRLTGRNFGVSEAPAVIQGLESFNDTDAAQLVIVDGLEDLKQKLSSAKVAIIEFFKNLYKHVIAIFVGLFDKLKGVEKRADIIMSRLNAMNDDQIKQNINLGSWNRYLKVDVNGDVLVTMAEVNRSLLIFGRLMTQMSSIDMLKETSNITDVFKDVIKKKSQQVKDDTSIMTGQVATISMEIKAPRFFKQYRAPIVSITFDSDAKTSGEYKDNIYLPELKKIIARTKSAASEARTGVINVNKLSKVRDDALKALEKYDHGTEAPNKIKTMHSIMTSLGKELMKYEGNVLLAAQKYVTAHF